MKITVDQGVCVASGRCVAVVPEVFDQRDEDGIVVLLSANAPAGTEDRHAVAICPARAISLQT
jgi:ferredoxin